MLRVLYVFSGKKRKNSVAAFFRKLSTVHEVQIEIKELDIQRDRRCDFTLPQVQQEWLARITRGDFWALILTPPCSTFSRATYTNDEGPFPLRSRRHPRGFPWLSRPRRNKAEFGNILADFSYEAYEAFSRQCQHSPGLAYMEQPEDLGATRHQRIPGEVPASMWQFPQFNQLLKRDGVAHGGVLPAGLWLGRRQADPLPDAPAAAAAPSDEARAAPLQPHLGLPGAARAPSRAAPHRQGPRRLQDERDGRMAGAAMPVGSPRHRHHVPAAQRLRERRGTIRLTEDEEGSPRGGGGDTGKEDESRGGRREVIVPVGPGIQGRRGPPRCIWKQVETPFHDGGGLPSPAGIQKASDGARSG